MKLNTTYLSYHENHQIVKWLWSILEDFDQTSRANFLFFVSGY